MQDISALVAPDSISRWPVQRIVHTASNLYTGNQNVFLILFLAESAAVQGSRWAQVQKSLTHEIYWLSSWVCPVTSWTGRVLLCPSHAAGVAGPGAVVLWQCEAEGVLRPFGFFFGECVGIKESMADMSQKYSKEKLSSSGLDFQRSWRLIAIGEVLHHSVTASVVNWK